MRPSFAILACFLFSNFAQAAIFGPDTRLEVTENSPYNSYARSTAIAVLSGNFSIVDGKVKLSLDQASSFVCSDQRFSQETSLSYACTGFLVAPNIIATAGHCMVNTGEDRNETETYCKVFSWLFDYQIDATGKYDSANIPEDKLYRCKQVIYAANESAAPYLDFALVELDRPVLGRTPLKLASNAETALPLSMIGYPLGMPAKYSHDAKILLDNQSRQSFITNLDAFEGNSGSPVFNRNMQVVGILVAGTPAPSTIDDNAKSCARYNFCDENGENCLLPDTSSQSQVSFQKIGSEVQRIAPLADMLNKIKLQ